MTTLGEWHAAHGATGTAWEPTGCVAASYGDPIKETEYGRTRAVFFDRSACARVQLLGADRRDLVQRLTTNDVTKVEEGQGIPTVITTSKGRIVDRVVLHAASDGDLMVGSPGQADAIMEWMGKYIIREDASLVDLGPSTAMVDVVGPRAAEALHAPLLAFANLHEMAVVDVAGVQVLAVRSDAVGTLTIRCIMPVELAPTVLDFLVKKGAIPGGGDAYNTLRLEAGLPLFGPELGQSWTPLEAGLIDAMHFAKGCYVGQEVAARMDTYMKQRRYLVALELDGVPPKPGAEILMPNGDKGEVTSSADLHNGKARAMGYLKTDTPTVGTVLAVVEEGVSRPAVVAHRPAQAAAPKGGEGNQNAAVA